MPRDSAQSPRAGIVYLTLHPAFVTLFRHRGPDPQRFRRKIAGLQHPERLENRLPRKLVHILSADSLHKVSEDNKADVAVNEFRSEFCGQLQCGDLLQTFFRCAGIVIDGVIGDQTTGMSQQVADGHLVFAVLSKFGPVAGDRRLYIESTLSCQNEDAGGGCNWFGKGCQIEYGIDRHGDLNWYSLAKAPRLFQHNPGAASHHHDTARHFGLADSFADNLVDHLQPLRVHSRTGRSQYRNRLW